MVNALKYFNAATAKEEPAYADFAISNVAADGSIVPMYTNITLDHAWSVADVVGYYHIAGIGSTRNLETHIFQVAKEDSIIDTVEWVAMDDAALSVFVPYYPMLTTDTYAGYRLSTAAADFVEAQPESGVYYATTKNKRNENGERVKVEGFCVLPENWADSVYWTMDALSNLYEYGTLTDEEKAQVETTLADLQAECYEVYNQLKADPDNATAISAAAAQKVHEACVALVNAVK